MLHIGIGRRDRFCVHGGVAVILPMLQMVYEIERQIGEQRLQLAGDADGFLGERGAVFLEPLRGLGALFRLPVEKLLVRALERRGVGLAQLRRLRGALLRQRAHFRFILCVRLLLCLACGLDLRIACVHKGQHRLKEQFEQQQAKLDTRLASLQSRIDEVQNGVNETNSFLSQFVKYRNLQTLTREVVVELIDMIYVHEGGKITIKFKFSDAYAAAQDYIRKHGKTA